MRSIWPLIMIILHGCGQTEDKTSSEQSKKYVSSLNLDELFKYDSLTAENPTLKMVETYRSPAACKLNREMNSLNAQIVEKVENKFCDTSEIEINKKYSIKLNDSNSPFKYLFRKIGDEKYIATHCHANEMTTVSIIETAGDGKGRVVLYYDVDGYHGVDKTEFKFKSVFEKFYQGSENIVSSHFNSIKRAEVSQELSYSEISFSSQGGSWISSLNTIVPNPIANDSNKQNFFHRSIQMFDSEHGHQLLNYGYPDESDERRRDVRRHEFFTLSGDALKESASAKFQENGTLFLDDSNLPDLITKADDLVTLEDEDIWDCEGVDIEKTLVCEIKSIKDDYEENCNFKLPQEFH